MQDDMTDSKETKTKEYRKFSVYLVIGAAITLFFVGFFMHLVTSITARMAYDAALSVKKAILQENVENLISFIDASADAFIAENPKAMPDEVEDQMTEITHSPRMLSLLIGTIPLLFARIVPAGASAAAGISAHNLFIFMVLSPRIFLSFYHDI